MIYSILAIYVIGLFLMIAEDRDKKSPREKS